MGVVGIPALGDRHQLGSKRLHHRAFIRENRGLQLADRADLGSSAGEKHLIGNEQLGFVHRALDHLNAHGLGQFDHAGSGDALKDVLINARCDQLTVPNEEQIHPTGFADLAPTVHEQGFIESAADGFRLGQGAGDVGPTDLAAQRQRAILLTGPAADTAADPFWREVIPEFKAVNQEIGLNVVQTWGDPEIACVHERPKVDRGLGLIGLKHGRERVHHRGFTQVCQQQFGALAEPTGMALGTEEKHAAWLAGVRNSPHAAEGACPVVEGVRCHRDLGLFKRHTPAFKPGEGQELMHG